jgi:NADP-dependent 3-hydroxy acid dehydrogenase YdfG
MVSLSHVLSSNARIATELPSSLVAVFAGATTGIGLATLKAFVSHAVAPRVYLLARNADVAAHVVEECLALNPAATLEVVKVDLSSVRATDAACAAVAAKEQGVNLVVLSMGEVRLDRACELSLLSLPLPVVMSGHAARLS